MKGILFALLAAICNSCIGIFSSLLMEQGMSSVEIAFMRCFVAFIFTFIVCFLNRNIRKDLSINKKEGICYAVLAFFGISIMYMFETTAIRFIPISLVSFLLYACGIITIVLGCIFLKEKMNVKKFTSICFVTVGIGIMFISNLQFRGNVVGILFAILAGTGYSLYIFLNKKWAIKSGMKTLFYVFLFGTVYLGIQVLIASKGTFPVLEISSIPFIILLAIIPTMGGFFFTNKAISLSAAGDVQLVEMSEPFIATLLGFLILKQTITYTDFLGGILIGVGTGILSLSKRREAN